MCWCKKVNFERSDTKGQKVNSHSGLSKYGWWGPLPLVQKGQTHTVGYAAGMQYAVRSRYTVCVSAKRSTERSNPHSGVGSRYAVCSRYTVCVNAKRSNHTVGYAVGMQYAVRSRYTVCVSAKRSTERSNPHSGVGSRYAVCSRYTVCVNAKRSNHTVDLANMGGGDRCL